MTKIAGSGSISQRHGSADPDPLQNVMDPQHWFKPSLHKHLRIRHGEKWYGTSIQTWGEPRKLLPMHEELSGKPVVKRTFGGSQWREPILL